MGGGGSSGLGGGVGGSDGGGCGMRPGWKGGIGGVDGGGTPGGDAMAHGSTLADPSLTTSFHRPVFPLGLSGSKSE